MAARQEGAACYREIVAGKEETNCLQEVFVSPIFRSVYVMRMTYASMYLKSRLVMPVSFSKSEESLLLILLVSKNSITAGNFNGFLPVTWMKKSLEYTKKIR